jgi:hypothetical protein
LGFCEKGSAKENYEQGKAEKRQVKNATVALSHNLGGAPQTCGICILATP